MRYAMYGYIIQITETRYSCEPFPLPSRRWVESVLDEDLPPTPELEDALQNGVYLCRIGMLLLPNEEMWKKVYDLDQSKFKVYIITN